jgi:hypothetical protein
MRIILIIIYNPIPFEYMSAENGMVRNDHRLKVPGVSAPTEHVKYNSSEDEGNDGRKSAGRGFEARV